MSFSRHASVGLLRALVFVSPVIAGSLLSGNAASADTPWTGNPGWHPHCGSVAAPSALPKAAAGASEADCFLAAAVGTSPSTAGAGGTASISGVVTEDGSGTPLPAACVLAVERAGILTSIARSDATGAYIVDGLPAGSYALQFFDCTPGQSHLSEWYDGQEDFNRATVVELAEGAIITNINASLALGGGTITGSVTADGTHEPLAEVCVFAVDDSDETAGSGATDGSGAFAINGLDSGDYILEFIDCADDKTHVLEWYDNQLTPATARPVHLISGSNTPGINASLALGATIAGVVREGSPSGAPLQGICVLAYDREGFFHGSDVTDETGAYAASGLPDIDLKLLFVDCMQPYHHLRRWRGGTTFQDATVVRPGGPGATRSGIDASLQLGGSIAGTVTDGATGGPVPGICIEVSSPSGDFEDLRLTIGDGSYEVGGLALGQHYLLIRDCRSDPEYAWEWFHDSSSFDDADTITVSSGTTTSANENISRGGVFSGRVTDQVTNEALPGICIAAIDSSQNSRGFDVADRSGHYAIALGSGSRKAFFFDCSEEPVYNPEWWHNKQSFEGADSFTIGGSGTTVTGRNGTLSLFLAGDVDCTRNVTAIDAALILQGVAGLLFEFECQYNADPDNDGVISAIDAALVLQFVAGLLPDL